MSYDYDEEESVASNGVYFKAEDLLHHLLLIWAVQYLVPGQAPTEFNKDGDAVVCDIVDLDQNDDLGQPGLLAQGNRFFQARLIRDLKGRVGRPPILAFLTQAPATKGRPPYELVLAHTDADCRARADAWRARNPDFKPSGGVAPEQIHDAVRTAHQEKAKPAVPAANAGVLERLRASAASAQAQAARLGGLEGSRRTQEEEPPF